MIPKKQNLVFFAKLNGGKSSDGKVLDFSDNGKHGTIAGTEAYTETINGKKMLACDGSTYVTVDNSGTSLAQTNTHTYVMRVKLQSTSSAGYLTLISKGGSTTTSSCIDLNNTFLRFFGYNESGVPKIVIYNYLSSGYFGKEAILTLVQDTNILKAYIDKTLVGTTDASGENWVTTTSNITPGSRAGGSRSDVPIGDFMLFDNVAFSQTEVEQIVDELNNPAEFSPKIVPSLTSDGVDDYIDTGVVPDTNTEMEVEFKLNSLTATQGIFGTFDSANNGRFSASIFPDNEFEIKIGDSNGLITTQFSPDLNVHTLKLTDGEIFYDGVSKKTFTSTFGSTTSSLALFRRSGTSVAYTSATIYSAKIWQSGVLVRHFIPQPNGTMLDTVNNVVYSNSGTGTLTYLQEPLELDDSSLVFSTRDGIRDLSGKNTITNTNTIVGKGVVLSNGSMTWQTLTPTSYIYVWTGADGIKKHYAYDGSDTYINGVLTGSQALTITATGFTGATGTLDYIKIYNSNLTAEQIKQSYEKSVRYW